MKKQMKMKENRDLECQNQKKNLIKLSDELNNCNEEIYIIIKELVLMEQGLDKEVDLEDNLVLAKETQQALAQERVLMDQKILEIHQMVKGMQFLEIITVVLNNNHLI